ncbi:homeobox-leucine zipper protein HOX9-like [Magnolia sinica]|uniref:homeobox-leucine zipper protein HOX9-like n=1 Tax=Magnolia sinica TaxID=86752 RepID=UPI002658BAB3|nr:homeobox-leucine zipper protein HOX9-like [Magnolia sinica]
MGSDDQLPPGFEGPQVAALQIPPITRQCPPRIAEILKDCPSWFRDCRSLEVFNMFPAGNRGTIELIYMQMYAPTTLAPPRNFWTLRYTTSLEDGSLVVCHATKSSL